MIKKITVYILLFSLCVFAITGCSKKEPTAKELISKISELENCEYVDYSKRIETNSIMTLNSDKTGIFGETDVEVTVINDVRCKQTKDVVYLEGTSTIEVLGMKRSIPIQSYAKIENEKKTVYSYEKTTGKWIIEEKEFNTNNDSSVLPIKSDGFFEYELKELKRKDKYYIVDTHLNIGSLSEELKASNDGLDNVEQFVIDPDLKIRMMLKFDKETLDFIGAEYSLNKEELAMNTDNLSIKINETKASFTINETGNKTLGIPEEIINTAMTEEELNEYIKNEMTNGITNGLRDLFGIDASE